MLFTIRFSMATSMRDHPWPDHAEDPVVGHTKKFQQSACELIDLAIVDEMEPA